jgi:hypothetical protein
VRAVVVGAGAVGGRAARQLLSTGPLEDLAIVEPNAAQASDVVSALGEPARHAATVGDALERADVVVLTAPVPHRPLAEAALEVGAHVVSVADGIADVRALLELDSEARERGVEVVIGAGFSPGLSCVLAAHAASTFDAVEEIHVAKVGTGGPSCARQHHRALGDAAYDWRDGAWLRRAGGSGRELCWFPEPVGGIDCYRAALGEPLLLLPVFPGLQRLTANLGANRRDRLTARLPMLRRPHPDGGLGALRVEVRGRRGTSRDERVLGVVDRPAVAAGAVVALAARWAAGRRMLRPGAAGLAALVEPIPFLAALAERGVRAAAFEGDAASRVSAASST